MHFEHDQLLLRAEYQLQCADNCCAAIQEDLDFHRYHEANMSRKRVASALFRRNNN